MCDTFVINKNKKKYFFKNSDRAPNEVNVPFYYPSKDHQEEMVKCTYISLPQVKHTNAIFVIKPSWIWGAEMGVNEYGVCIGNEAVFTKTKSKVESLIGMDYLRLALERSKSAKEAVNVIIDLLKQYSQGGNCGYDHEFYYNNSYLISDYKESYVLETVGKEYAYKKVETYNISNRLTLEENYDESSVKKNFRKTYSDFLFTTFSCSKTRSLDGCMLNKVDNPSLENCLKILTHHHANNAITKGDTSSVCMHKNAIGDHSTGSFIVDLNHKYPLILIGGCSPCISIFKPYILGDEILNNDFNKAYDYFLNQKLLNRLVLGGYIDYVEYKTYIDSINKEILEKLEKCKTKEEIKELSIYAFNKEKELIDKYNKDICLLKNEQIKLKGIWHKISNKPSSNPFSSKLEERIK